MGVRQPMPEKTWRDNLNEQPCEGGCIIVPTKFQARKQLALKSIAPLQLCDILITYYNPVTDVPNGGGVPVFA